MIVGVTRCNIAGERSSVAQSAERTAVNRDVSGSSPLRGAIFSTAKLGDSLVNAKPRRVTTPRLRRIYRVFKEFPLSYLLLDSPVCKFSLGCCMQPGGFDARSTQVFVCRICDSLFSLSVMWPTFSPGGPSFRHFLTPSDRLSLEAGQAVQMITRKQRLPEGRSPLWVPATSPLCRIERASTAPDDPSEPGIHEASSSRGPPRGGPDTEQLIRIRVRSEES